MGAQDEIVFVLEIVKASKIYFHTGDRRHGLGYVVYQLSTN